MFTLLLIIGSFLIVLGIVKNKKQPANPLIDTGSNSINSMEFHELRERIDHIENTLFYDIPKLPEEDEEGIEEIEKVSTPENIDDYATYESIAKLVTPYIPQEEINSSNSALEKFTLLCQYEKENYGIEEICILLNMKKGEVLLLKNLYKTLFV